MIVVIWRLCVCRRSSCEAVAWGQISSVSSSPPTQSSTPSHSRGLSGARQTSAWRWRDLYGESRSWHRQRAQSAMVRPSWVARRQPEYWDLCGPLQCWRSLPSWHTALSCPAHTTWCATLMQAPPSSHRTPSSHRQPEQSWPASSLPSSQSGSPSHTCAGERQEVVPLQRNQPGLSGQCEDRRPGGRRREVSVSVTVAVSISCLALATVTTGHTRLGDFWLSGVSCDSPSLSEARQNFTWVTMFLLSLPL